MPPIERLDVSLGSDGQCTGFPGGVEAFKWDWSACCSLHDVGASDGTLVDCVVSAAPGLPAVVVLAAVTLMALFRPLYNVGQRWGWWR